MRPLWCCGLLQDCCPLLLLVAVVVVVVLLLLLAAVADWVIVRTDLGRHEAQTIDAGLNLLHRIILSAAHQELQHVGTLGETR